MRLQARSSHTEAARRLRRHQEGKGRFQVERSKTKPSNDTVKTEYSYTPVSACSSARLQAAGMVALPYPTIQVTPHLRLSRERPERMSTLVLLRQVRSPGQITFQWFGWRRHSFPSSTNVRLCSLQHWLLLSFFPNVPMSVFALCNTGSCCHSG